MEALGIEIGRDSWRILHVKGSLKRPIILKHSEALGTLEERVSVLSKYISSNHLSNANLGFVFPREASISRVLEIPAPTPEAIDGIVRFEIEKHLPSAISDFYFGYQVMKRNENTYSILIGAVDKKRIDALKELLATVGIEPLFIYFWHEAICNSLIQLGIIAKNEKKVFISVNGREITIDAFSGILNIYSKKILLNSIGTLREFQSELLGRKLEECSITFSTDPGVEVISFIQDVKRNFNVLEQKNGLKPSALAAFGGALAVMRSGKARINLLTSIGLEKSKYLGNALFSVVVVILLALLGISYITKDYTTLWRLDNSISELKEFKEGKSGSLNEKVTSISDKITILRSISTNSSANFLMLLKELTEALPDDSWLTLLEYRDGAVMMEGISGNASSLLLKLENSKLMKDFEFMDPVVRVSNGKEKFRIRCKVRSEKGGNA
ncbi:MAG: PilN domain-containing protein [Deltaproteobacteria bacterium]|nr:PilN domain-containing protein [Deltaproteobacteria bacterium]